MILQHFTAGEIIKVPTNILCGFYSTETTAGMILYPITDGRYAIKLKNGYVIAHHDDLLRHNSLRHTPPIYPWEIKVMFLGNGEFGASALRGLIQMGYNICCVVTSPDSPHGRGGKLKPSPVKQVAVENNLAIIEPKKLDSQRFLKRVIAAHASIGVVCDYKILPKVLYEKPRYGTINLHSSLLPRHKGSSTIISAIKHGDAFTGLTAIRINDKVDDGSIITNMGIEITDTDNNGSVFEKLSKIAGDVLHEAIGLRLTTMQEIPQSKLRCMMLEECDAPRLSREDYQIDWLNNAEYIERFVRAHSPKPGAWTTLKWLCDKEELLKILDVTATNDRRGIFAPGEVVIKGDRMYIATGDMLMEILRVKSAGRNEMSVSDWLRGHRGTKKGYCKLKHLL